MGVLRGCLFFALSLFLQPWFNSGRLDQVEMQLNTKAITNIPHL